MISEKRRSVLIAIVLGAATAMSILFLVYAFVQKEEAGKQKILALEAEKNEALCKRTIQEKDSLIRALETEIQTLKKSKTASE